MRFKTMARALTPPIIWDWLHTQFRRDASAQEWEYVAAGWDSLEQNPAVGGWDHQSISETEIRKWEKFTKLVSSQGPLGIAHESNLTSVYDLHAHNAVMSFAYVLALAAHTHDAISMLDWGGGIGHYLLFAHALYPDLQIDYHCKDMPGLVEYGRKLHPGQHFYADESCLEQKYDLVMASTSLHYSKQWQDTLTKLASATENFLYIANLPIVIDSSSFVFVQRPYRYGYMTEYLGWCLNRTEFLAQATTNGLDLVREFVYGHSPVIHGAPEQNAYRGYLFRAPPSAARDA